MNCLIFILLIAFYGVSSEIDLQLLQPKLASDEKYCFEFTWLGPISKETETKINCSATDFDHIPCIPPFDVSHTLPNYTEVWAQKTKIKELRPGYSCIKYTYSFNNAIVNVSHFSGKMVIDTVNVVEKGCYKQKIRGYEVETCACRTKGFKDEIPCNSSTRNYYSLLKIIFIALVPFLKYCNLF